MKKPDMKIPALIPNASGISGLVPNASGISGFVPNASGISGLVPNASGISGLVPNASGNSGFARWLGPVLIFFLIGFSAPATGENLLSNETPLLADSDVTIRPAQDLRQADSISVVPPELTIDDAIEMALACNRTLEVARQAIKIAEAGGQSAMAEFLPDISAVYNWTHNLAANVIEIPDVGEYEISPMDSFFIGLTFEYSLYDGGREDAVERANDAETEAAELQFEQIEAMTRLAVFQTYTQVLEVQANLAASRKSVEHLDEVQRMAQANYDAGYIPMSDLLAVQVARSQAQVATTQLMGTNALGQSALAILIGGDAGDRFTLFPVEYPASTVPFTLDTLNEWALASRPELKEINSQRVVIEAQMDALETIRNPQVSLRAEVTRAGGEILGETTNVAGTINIFWDLYDFGRTDDLLGPMEEQLVLLDIRQADLESRIRQEIEVALFITRLQLQNLAVSEEALTAAEEAFRVTQRRQEEGLGLMLEVLDAEASLARAEVGYTHILYEYFRGIATLAQAVGVTTNDMVALINAQTCVDSFELSVFEEQ